MLASSHTVEHIPDPCGWVADVRRALKPGGHVFTELPLQHGQASLGPTHIRGQFHATFFSNASFTAMMSRAGFELVETSRGEDKHAVSRQLHRWPAPDSGPDGAGQPQPEPGTASSRQLEA